MRGRDRNDAESERSEGSDLASSPLRAPLPLPAFVPNCWCHVIAGTLGSWLPGDPRGFRSRGHRVHSSGDYRNPPPQGEHAGLLRHVLEANPRAVVIPPSLREAVGLAMLTKLNAMGTPVASLAVVSNHAHALIAVGETDAVRVFGRAKQHASKALAAELPGKLWGRSSHVVRVGTASHLMSTVRYIAQHREEGAWVWVHPGISAGDGSRP